MINPYEYYINLDKMPFKREHGFIKRSGAKKFNGVLNACKISNAIFYSKSTYYKNTILQTMASAKLFHDANIYTPPIFASIDEVENYVYQLTQKVQSIPKFKHAKEAANTEFATKLYNSNDFLKLYKNYNLLTIKNWEQITNWLPLYSPEMKAMYLEFMTEKCFDEYINMFLLDTLRTENDRHLKNYFFYKGAFSKKYEGIIPIDLDRVAILCDCEEYPYTNFDFKHCLYDTKTPIGTLETVTHQDRLNVICRLLQDRVLSESNINTIRTALGFDMGKTIKEIGKKYGLTEQEIIQVYNPIARLWEYNQNTLSREF